MAKYKELSNIKDFDIFDGTFLSIKDCIFMRLFNKENIPLDKSLDSIPHSIFADLAITFSIEQKVFKNKQKHILCYMITNEDMEMLNTNIKQLTETAIKNLNNKNSVRIESIQEHTVRSHIMHPLTKLPDGLPVIMDGPFTKNNSVFSAPKQMPIINNIENKKDVLLISNRTQTFAAINYTFPKTLERISDKFKESFYIIPLSVHELVCIRENYASKNGELTIKETVEELADMVEEVNEIINLNTADILSYNIYYHSSDERCTMIVT